MIISKLLNTQYTIYIQLNAIIVNNKINIMCQIFQTIKILIIVKISYIL
jgi:hypothetical protein